MSGLTKSGEIVEGVVVETYTYRVEDESVELLETLRDTYGIEIPPEAAGEISNYLCDAFFWGEREGHQKAAREASGKRRRVRLPATSG